MSTDHKDYEHFVSGVLSSMLLYVHTDHKDYEHFVSGVEAQCCFTSTETIRTRSVVAGDDQ